jgi:hypothetical protein
MLLGLIYQSVFGEEYKLICGRITTSSSSYQREVVLHYWTLLSIYMVEPSYMVQAANGAQNISWIET